MNATRHDEIRDLLPAHAMELLSPDERALVINHLSDCADCSDEVAALRATAGELALAAPDRSFDARRCNGVRSRLLARTAADREARARLAAGQLPEREPFVLREMEATQRDPSNRWRLAFVLLAAVIAGLIVVGGGMLLQTRDDLAQAREIESQQRQLIAGLLGPEVRVIELSSTQRRAGRARMFWDQARGSWTLIATEMATPAAGRAYQVWLITRDDRKISAGVFAPSSEGNAIARATHVLATDAVASVAVTEEPTGGVASPTGAIVLAGTVRNEE